MYKNILYAYSYLAFSRIYTVLFVPRNVDEVVGKSWLQNKDQDLAYEGA